MSTRFYAIVVPYTACNIYDMRGEMGITVVYGSLECPHMLSINTLDGDLKVYLDTGAVILGYNL